MSNTRVANLKNKIGAFLKNSKYINWICNNTHIILLFTFISTFLCIVSYPGVIYSDSYGRISMASDLKLVTHAFLDGNAVLTDYDAWLTVIPSFLILLSLNIVGSIVLYTFFQSICFWIMTYIFGDMISNGKNKWWNICCLIFCPIIWGYSVYYEASVLCVTAILTLLILIWQYDCLQNKFDQIISCFLIITSSLICFGYRANAFTIVPALIVVILIKYGKKLKSLVITASIIAGFSLSIIVPNILNINTMSSFAASFVWEGVSTIEIMDESDRAEYIDYYDDIFGDGATQAAVENNNRTNICAMLDYISGSAISEPGNSTKILSKYIKLALNEPKAFLKNKIDFVSRALGIGATLGFWEYNYNRWDNMAQFGFNDSNQRLFFVDYLNSYMKYMKIWNMPWILFLLALVLILTKRFLLKEVHERITLAEGSYLVAVFYYAAYLIDTQSFEFRYFFPSWLILFVIICSLIGDLLFRTKYVERLTISAISVFIIVGFLGGYNEYTRSGNEALANIENVGNLLYQDDENEVLYLNGKLYFIATPNSDTEYRYFLHFYPAEGDMINSDFWFKDKALITAFWNKKIAEVSMPNQDINSIEFGQYYNSERFWGANADVSSMY